MTPIRRRLLPALLVLCGASAAGLAAWHIGWPATLRLVAARAETDLTLTSERLIAQLQSYRELAVLLADHPEVEALLRPGFAVLDPTLQEVTRREAETLLQEIADKTGALRIGVYRSNGQGMAQSDLDRGARLPLLWQEAAERAFQGALGLVTGVDPDSGRRSFAFAAPVFTRRSAAPSGVLVVAADLEAIEAEWRADPVAVFFRDAQGRVMLSNRSELVLATMGARGGAFPDYSARKVAGHDLWRLPPGGRYLPGMALHVGRDLPQIGMRADVLVDLATARRIALTQTGLAVLAALSAGALGLWLMARRDALRNRLRAEAAAKEALEARVRDRTRDLSQANDRLRHEVAERREAEARLKAAQDRLVQARKLSALGEMSAGISHELNQPLMAIQSFSENARLLLERGRTDVVAQNLGRISELGERMGRIIRNLRAFARQESAPVRPVDPVRVVEAVLDMAGSRLQDTGMHLDWQPPEGPVRVMAGEVRLQQVLTNLVQNALDAMEPGGGTLSIAIEPAAGEVRIRVADRGPGLAHPDRIFDPFYTTKAVGPAEGMGLGLSISYGLVQSFGGNIEGRNRTGGGAVFTVTLPVPPDEAQP
ncbi:sensor histidine kinase [Mangrovicoccus algicola]|uniref:C4-dicarboxylate transport sensor protein DctB n=1 Tax=Mangrovicoccus algicola TaxID=2771008 RepID=A0A8J6YPI2_9RHOB|nr:ATP-binding protein [Mangrovicoccus algicola]MBE3637023.1 sensor histidine kinase [Mangrovicoccus algicola]